MEVYDKKATRLIEKSYQTAEIIHQRLRTLSALALNTGESILDVGCGTGLLLDLQADAVGDTGKAVGVDLSPDMLEVARNRCGDKSQVSLHQVSAESLPFDDKSFDAVSCTQTLLYVEQLDRALAELYRVLKPHGRIAIVETDWRGAVLNSQYPLLTRRVFDAWDSAVSNPNLPATLKPMLAGTGFGAIRVEAIPVLNAGYSDQSYSAGMLDNFATTAVKKGFIEKQESIQWLEDQHRLAADNAYFFCVNRFLFSAVR